jgi:D-sedoheptulose 7-phosphate isomerase
MYYKNYYESISIGLFKTEYFIGQKIVDPGNFYAAIKQMLSEIKEKKSRIFFFGNGASSAFANHMALDFTKNGKINSKSLSDSSMLTALANDYSYDGAMTEFMKLEHVNSNDLVITISSSGNSSNVVNVLEYCVSNQIRSVTLSGLREDNFSKKIGNYAIFVPMKTYGIVECIHQVVLHLMLDELMGITEWDRDEPQNMNDSNFVI